MQDKVIKKIDEKIGTIVRGLSTIGPMRPGGLTRQYQNPAAKEGGYWKLSCTHQGKGTSENVRDEELEGVRAELKEYRRFKDLCGRWVELALQRSRREREINRRAARESKGGR